MSVPAFDRGAMMSTEEQIVYDAYNEEYVIKGEHERRIAASAIMNSPMVVSNTYSSHSLENEVQRRLSQTAAMQSTAFGGPSIRAYLDLKQMIYMRLRMAVGEEIPFEFLEAHRTGDVVHVFVVVNGQPLTLSDGHTLFPSDDLITKLNLLRK